MKQTQTGKDCFLGAGDFFCPEYLSFPQHWGFHRLFQFLLANQKNFQNLNSQPRGLNTVTTIKKQLTLAVYICIFFNFVLIVSLSLLTRTLVTSPYLETPRCR